jgi:lipopolysaccharide/colanic/teichoic acid biosynthesis glycosyltransferase
MVKRSMDLVGSTFGLVLLSPILLIVALLIRLDSRGPVLFRQQRVGLNGRTFWCLKFRTMVADAEQRLFALEARNESSCGVLFKIKNDPRITPLGRLLRRTSLDELPQLWNVLIGEMSLIGPRPLQLRDSERLELLEPEGYYRRLSVLPGLSGPWQVAGRSNLDGGRMLDLDMDYVENWSVVMDLTLLFKTVNVVLRCKGAC